VKYPEAVQHDVKSDNNNVLWKTGGAEVTVETKIPCTHRLRGQYRVVLYCYCIYPCTLEPTLSSLAHPNERLELPIGTSSSVICISKARKKQDSARQHE
jgi:hypothetical protein